MAAAAGRRAEERAGVQSGYCHQMLMECRTNRYNNPYMVLLPAALQCGGRRGKELWGSKTAALSESIQFV